MTILLIGGYKILIITFIPRYAEKVRFLIDNPPPPPTILSIMPRPHTAGTALMSTNYLALLNSTTAS